MRIQWLNSSIQIKHFSIIEFSREMNVSIPHEKLPISGTHIDLLFHPIQPLLSLSSALFPCGDSMVCIIDDREDVWNYARNLVHVKPYVWFKDVGDINDIHLPSPPIPSEQLIPPISEKEFEEQLENSEHIAEERIEMDSNALIERTTEEGFQNAIHRGEKRKLNDDNDDDVSNENTTNEEGTKKLKEQNE